MTYNSFGSFYLSFVSVPRLLEWRKNLNKSPIYRSQSRTRECSHLNSGRAVPNGNSKLKTNVVLRPPMHTPSKSLLFFPDFFSKKNYVDLYRCSLTPHFF